MKEIEGKLEFEETDLILPLIGNSGYQMAFKGSLDIPQECSSDAESAARFNIPAYKCRYCEKSVGRLHVLFSECRAIVEENINYRNSH